jgi:PAS domain S-box-containing protein
MAQLELRRRLAELERASTDLKTAHERENSHHEEIVREQARELYQSEERFRAIFDHAGLGIGELDAEGHFLMVNDRWCEIVKRDRSELLGMRVIDLTHPDDRETTLGVNARLFSGEVPWISYEKRYLCGSGANSVWVRVTTTSIRSNKGNFLRGIAMVEDITERRHFQAELERCVTERTSSLREALSGLEAFSYSLSHDMRAPLRAIKGYASIVLDNNREKLGPEGVAGLERVLNATHRLDRLITDVLAFSRVSREEIQLRPVNVKSLLQGIIQDRPEFMAPKAMVTIEEPIPPVLGHEAFLTQCLTNLLANAVKFVPPGVTPGVRIYAAEDGEWVRLFIHDNGIGFPAEAGDKIFNIFQRLHASTSYEGTGIGLAIVKRAAERMGGAVGVESQPGQGSRFWLQLKATNSSKSNRP